MRREEEEASQRALADAQQRTKEQEAAEAAARQRALAEAERKQQQEEREGEERVRQRARSEAKEEQRQQEAKSVEVKAPSSAEGSDFLAQLSAMRAEIASMKEAPGPGAALRRLDAVSSGGTASGAAYDFPMLRREQAAIKMQAL